METGMGAVGLGAVKEGFPKWAYSLVAMMIVVFGANGYMVWLSSSGRHDLVRSDYYDAGLDQDGTITRNGMADLPGMDVSLHREGKAWSVEAGSPALADAACSIRLYRPDDVREDRTLVLGEAHPAPQSNRLLWTASAPALRKGYWVAQLVWSRGGKAVMEKSFRIYVEG